MSRTYRGSKSGGEDFWSRRPHSGNGFGPSVKRKTKRTERQQDRFEVQNELELIHQEELERRREEMDDWLYERDTFFEELEFSNWLMDSEPFVDLEPFVDEMSYENP